MGRLRRFMLPRRNSNFAAGRYIRAARGCLLAGSKSGRKRCVGDSRRGSSSLDRTIILSSSLGGELGSRPKLLRPASQNFVSLVQITKLLNPITRSDSCFHVHPLCVAIPTPPAGQTNAVYFFGCQGVSFNLISVPWHAAFDGLAGSD